MLALPVVTGVFVCLGLLVRVNVLPFALPLMVAGLVALARRRFEISVPVLVSFVIITVLGAVLGSIFLDPSYDGNAYHRSAALCLTDGWNPVWGEKCGRSWTDDYPMLSWIYSAAQSTWSGHTESGMAINLVVTAGTLLVSAWLGQRLGLGSPVAAMLGIAVVLNPVNVTQFWSSYVDGLSGSYFSVAILAVASLASPRVAFDNRWVHVVLAICLVALVSLKFTGLLYAGVAFLGAAGIVLVRAQRVGALTLGQLRPTASVYLAAGAAALVISFNPYVVNVIEGEHLLHPVLGADRAEFVEGLTPQCLDDTTRIDRPFRAMLFPTSLNSRTCSSADSLRSDFSLSSLYGEFDYLGVGAWRLSGFGPLMPFHVVFGALSLTVLSGLALARKQIGLVGPSYTILSLSLATTFLIEPNWWARYVPQLWLIACLPIVLAVSRRGWVSIAAASVVLFSLTASGVPSFLRASEISVEASLLAAKLDHELFDTLTISHPQSSFGPGHLERQERFGWQTIEYIDRGDVPCGSASMRMHPNSVYLLASDPFGATSRIEELLALDDFQIFVVVKDEATRGLSDSQREAFRERGVPIDDLGYRGSLAAAIVPAGTTYAIDNERSVHVSAELTLDDRRLEVELRSAGFTSGNNASVSVAGLDVARAGRGLNVVVFDPTGAFGAAFTFDTFSGSSVPSCA